MDVAVTELRAHLSEYLSRVRDGDEVFVTERGIPVARLTRLDATATLERLTESGQIGRPSSPCRPAAAGRTKPQPSRPIAEIVSELR